MTEPVISFTLVDDEGDEVEYNLPAYWEVCSRCDGHGKHVNPAIDGNGITPEQFAEDPDFEEAYFAGVYDITCETCKGLRMVPAADIKRWSFAQKRAYVRYLKREREYQRDYDSERWLRYQESGGY